MTPGEHFEIDERALARLPNLFPRLECRDAEAMLGWLEDAFGFEPHAIFPDGEGGIAHAQMRLGAGLVFVRSAVAGSGAPGAASIFVALPASDLEAHIARARAAGVEITAPLAETDFGTLEYHARDPEGNAWTFGSYQPLAADLVEGDSGPVMPGI